MLFNKHVSVTSHAAALVSANGQPIFAYMDFRIPLRMPSVTIIATAGMFEVRRPYFGLPKASSICSNATK
jgi:hypothetical protein